LLEVTRLPLNGMVQIHPRRFVDERGFFSETWSAPTWHDAGLTTTWVQDNHSYSAAKGVVRGLHFQLAPFAQDKLVRVSRGAVFDVAVDLRRRSPTYGKWAGAILSAELWNQLFIPGGFAHGFMTLEDDTEVQYKVSAPYSREHERSLRFDDPAIAIAWPDVGGPVRQSAKDRDAPLLAALEGEFA